MVLFCDLIRIVTTIPRFLLLSLALIGDIVAVLPKTKRESLDFCFGKRIEFYRRQSLTNAVRRLLKTKKIKKVAENGRVKIQITPMGLAALGMSFNLNKFSDKPWDRTWRLVIFDVEEKSKRDRDSLRWKLKELGFAMLQESVWISPLPLEKELREYFVSQKIRGEVLVTCSKVLVGDQRALAEKCWRMDELNEEYEELCDSWESKEAKRDVREAFDFEKNFLDLILKDPFLPRDLLPERWYGKEARRIYLKEVRNILQTKT